MRRLHSEAETSSLSVNLTPMIDLVFILLIFFIVTSSFAQETGIEVERPSAETATVQEVGSIHVSVTRDGAVWIKKKQFALHQLRAELEARQQDKLPKQVILIPDASLSVNKLVAVLDQVRLAGIHQISISATVR